MDNLAELILDTIVLNGQKYTNPIPQFAGLQQSEDSNINQQIREQVEAERKDIIAILHTTYEDGQIAQSIVRSRDIFGQFAGQSGKVEVRIILYDTVNETAITGRNSCVDLQDSVIYGIDVDYLKFLTNCNTIRQLAKLCC
jgi:hypothetical protein